MYKALGSKWINQGFCYALAFVSAKGTKPAFPNTSYTPPLGSNCIGCAFDRPRVAQRCGDSLQLDFLGIQQVNTCNQVDYDCYRE